MSSFESKHLSFRRLILIRWVGICFVALLVLVLEKKFPDHPFSGVWAILLIVSVFNILMLLLSPVRRLAGFLTVLGFLLDGLLLCWGVSITGGPLSAYIPFYLFIIMAACLVASPPVAVFTALLQIILFLSTLWFCYHHHIPSDFTSRNSNLFYGILESAPPDIRVGIYLEQAIRWTVFFILDVLVCGLLVRQVWNREERLRTQEKSLEQKRHLIQMGELTGRIAHGVNTPLGLISGNLEMVLAETRKGSKTHKNLLQIEHYVQRAIRTVRDILDYSRQSLSEIKSVSLAQVINSVVSAIQPKLKKAQGQLVLDVDPQLPEMKAYPEGLFQVLLNLVENAVDSIPAGGLITLSAHFQYRSMRLSPEDRRGEIRVAVRDTGKGIPPAELRRIFEPFYSTKGFGKGTGLGLAIVKRIVDEHKGEIKVESRLGEGTVFTLLFPTDGLVRRESSKPGDFNYNENNLPQKEKRNG
jgi:signal transduction histidine kinase